MVSLYIYIYKYTYIYAVLTARLNVITNILLWSLIHVGFSAALLSRSLSNLRAIWKVEIRISWLRDLTRSCDEPALRLTALWNISYGLKRHNLFSEVYSGLQCLPIITVAQINCCVWSVVSLWLILPILWWRRDMEKVSPLVAICKRSSTATGGFPSESPVMRGFGIFFYVSKNKLLWTNSLVPGNLRHHAAQ